MADFFRNEVFCKNIQEFWLQLPKLQGTPQKKPFSGRIVFALIPKKFLYWLSWFDSFQLKYHFLIFFYTFHLEKFNSKHDSNNLNLKADAIIYFHSEALVSCLPFHAKSQTIIKKIKKYLDPSKPTAKIL